MNTVCVITLTVVMLGASSYGCGWLTRYLIENLNFTYYLVLTMWGVLCLVYGPIFAAALAFDQPDWILVATWASSLGLNIFTFWQGQKPSREKFEINQKERG